MNEPRIRDFGAPEVEMPQLLPFPHRRERAVAYLLRVVEVHSCNVLQTFQLLKADIGDARFGKVEGPSS